MADYSLVLNSVYTPFTYNELLAPISRMSDVQDKLAAEYETLAEKSDNLEVMGLQDRSGDSQLYQTYNNYSAALKDASNDLFTNGLNADTRAKLHDVRTRYRKEILPIQNAWTKRQQEAAEQQQLINKDPNMMVSRSAADTPLQYYMDNPTGGYKVIDGKMIYTQVGVAAAKLAETIRNNPNGEQAAELKQVDPYTYQAIIRRGLTPAEISDWQNHPWLRNVADKVLKANGVTREDLGDSYDDIYTRALGYAGEGMYNAIGKQETQYMDNYGAREALRHQNAIDEADRQYQNNLALALAKEGAKGGNGASGAGGTTPLTPFPTTAEDAPLIMRDEKAQKNIEKSGQTLGLPAKGAGSKRNDGYHFKKYVDNPTVTEMMLTSKAYTSAVDEQAKEKIIRAKGRFMLYDNNNKILSKEQFVAQGKDEETQKKLAKYYDKEVTPALQSFGYDIGATPRIGELSEKYHSSYIAQNPQTVPVYDFYHNDTDDYLKIGNLSAYPMSGFTRDGGFTATGKAIPLSTLLTENKRTGNDKTLSITGQKFTTYGGHPALIYYVTDGGEQKMYNVPLDENNPNVKAAMYAVQQRELALQQMEQYKGTIYEQQFANAAKRCENEMLSYLNKYSSQSYAGTEYKTEKQPTDTELGM